MTRPGEHSGFTLIEVLVAMTLGGIIMGAVLGAFSNFQTQDHYDQVRNETQDSARSASDRLVHDLRNVAAPKATLPGAIERAEPYSIVFQTIDSSRPTAGKNTSDAMRVRYCLNDSNPANEAIWRQEQRWESAEEPAVPTSTACPDKPGWEASTMLAQHVSNRIFAPEEERPLFLYGPKSAKEVWQITAVTIDIFIDLSVGRHPGESELTSTVSFRNENRPPTAAFTVTPRGLHTVELNASESSDPDGLALRYKWWDGSTLLNTTSQIYTITGESPGRHTYKLEVTNPGGLHGEAEQTRLIE
jgi:prepilin-type N-terminal cleavage/methylation domain-containing protein